MRGYEPEKRRNDTRAVGLELILVDAEKIEIDWKRYGYDSN